MNTSDPLKENHLFAFTSQCIVVYSENTILEGIILLIERQIQQYQSLNKWFLSPLGLVLSNEFTLQLTALKDYLKGETLLQLGNCGDNPWLNVLDFKHKWVDSPIISDEKADIISPLNQIPLNRNSLDCVLAPLTLEPFGSSYSLIDEIDRVLKPMGFIILLSINPWSLWGAAMKCGALHCYSDRAVKMRTAFTINRIFSQRGYRQCSLNNFCYIPPINSSSIIKKLSFFDEIGKMIWPFPSGFYCYIAQKYEYIAPSLMTQPVQHTTPGEYKAPLQPAIN